MTSKSGLKPRDRRNLRIPRKFQDFSLETSDEIPVAFISPLNPSVTMSNGTRISGSIAMPTVKPTPEPDKPSKLLPRDLSTPEPVPYKKPPGRPKKAPNDVAPLQTSNRINSNKELGKGGSGSNSNSDNIHIITSNGPLIEAESRASILDHDYGQFQKIQHYDHVPKTETERPTQSPKTRELMLPITGVARRIENRAKEAAKILSKAKACMDYQDNLTEQYDMTPNCIPGKISKYLEAQDLLKLRQLNKVWRSMIDGQDCWKTVKIGRRTKIVDWKKFVTRLKGTSELNFNEFTPTTSASSIIESLYAGGLDKSLRHIRIRSVNEVQNKFAIELACALTPIMWSWCTRKIIDWEVRIVVDDFGKALVPIRCEKFPPPEIMQPFWNQAKEALYCYSVLPRLLGDPEETVWVELSEIEALFDGHQHSKVKIKPI